jgi:hypothetical protein
LALPVAGWRGVGGFMLRHANFWKAVTLTPAVGIVRCAGCKTMSWAGILRPVAAERRVVR